MSTMPSYRGAFVFVLVALLGLTSSVAAELEPATIDRPLGPSGHEIGRYSERTLVVGLELDRERVRLVGYTLKAHPFARDLSIAAPRPFQEGSVLQLEAVLTGASGMQYTQRIDVQGLCLAHGSASEPHIAGDTVRLHREVVIVELPELVGLDRVELAYYEASFGEPHRRALGTAELNRESFRAAGGPASYSDLLFSDPGDHGSETTPAASDVIWPEDLDDPDLYRVYGDEAEGVRRINIVIVPDGYTYAQKALMESHADDMVDHFRQKRPYLEHDPFVNYILVYAYSQDSGTDQCDCDIVENTAMGTRFLEQNPQCGHSDNRCLYYGNGCDTSGVGNIVSAELRAPYHDTSIVMVNTTRYGGCGGLRSVYSAGNGAAKEVAVHELGHSLGGLADEYAYNAGCGGGAGEINTSSDAVDGAWPEWVAEIGAPREGAQYFQQCIYRPLNECEMRSLSQPFCPVCNQHWSLMTYGHPNVSPTAPIESASPSASVAAWTGVPVDFSVTTRLSVGPVVTNKFAWTVTGPGIISGTPVSQDPAAYSRTFNQPGQYVVTYEVIADSNFVKPNKYGANRESMVWQVDVAPLAAPLEVSPPGSSEPLLFTSPQDLVWEDASAAGAFAYNLYRGDVGDLAGGSYGACLEPDIELNGTTAGEEPPANTAWAYLVTGVNPVGEGPLGSASFDVDRSNASPCE